jgi:hypothetical protein
MLCRFTVILLGLLIFNLKISFSQTDSLNLTWDANPEPDMYRYYIYRSVNDFSHFQFLNSTFHPHTQYSDHNSIEPGNLYAYTLVAVDSGGNMSDFSDTVAVGIPHISWNLTTLFNGRTTSISLNTICSDPDNQLNELLFTISNTQHLIIQVSNGMLEITPDPISYIGQGSFNMRVEDPAGFWDKIENVTLSILQSSPSGIQQVGVSPPSKYQLFQNFPNPFNPSTTIKFALPQFSKVKIALYNVLGQRLGILQETRLPAGFYQFNINLSDLPSGIYLYSIETEHFLDMQKMMLIK